MTEVTGKQRLHLMDDLKLLSSYFVVFIHCEFPGVFGVIFKTLARFAVPYFFLCSGYFLYGAQPESIIKKLLRTVKMFLITYLIYILIDVASYMNKHDLEGLFAYFHNFLEFEKLGKFILFNQPPMYIHLWYLIALFYVYAIYYYIVKYNVSDFLTMASAVILLFLHLLIAHILLVFEISFSSCYIRNFLFVGYPFVSIGRMMKKYQDKFPKLRGKTIIFLLFFGSICSLISRFVVGNKSLPFGAIVVSITLMFVVITANNLQKPKVANAGIYSTYIYLFHILVIRCYSMWVYKMGIENGLLVDLAPVFVCILATVFAIIVWMLVKGYRIIRSSLFF